MTTSFVRHGNNATMYGFVAVRSLTVDEGSTVFIRSNRLLTGETCLVGTGANYACVDIDEQRRGTRIAERSIVNTNAEVTFNNGRVDANKSSSGPVPSLRTRNRRRGR